MLNMVTLFKSQFMLIRWQATSFDYENKVSDKKTRHLISLDIVIQMNGWLRTLTQEYKVYKFPESSEITFADWQRWTEFYSLMHELGYPMYKGEVHEVVLWGSSVMKEWITRLYPNEVYVEDFEGKWTDAIRNEELVVMPSIR